MTRTVNGARLFGDREREVLRKMLWQVAKEGLRAVWADHAGRAAACGHAPYKVVLQAHREFIFGKRAADPGLPEMSRQNALKVLEQEDALLPRATVLRCRVRYFTDGAILGSQEFVRGFAGTWQQEKRPVQILADAIQARRTAVASR